MNKFDDLENLSKWFNCFESIGEDSGGGVTRLGYSSKEDEMHSMLKEISEEMGFITEEDSVGNTFVQLKKMDYSNSYLIGSHLDSVPNGGRYDGVAGILAGLLILKWIQVNKLNIPVKVAAFRCEESSAYGRATIGSSIVTGAITSDELKTLKNKEGKSLYEVLTSKGYSPAAYPTKNIKKYIELHIEQGRVLWDKGVDIGIVTSIAAPKRFRLVIQGRQDHSGATPMDMRKDALCGAAEVILEVEKLGREEAKYSTVSTVGIIKSSPNVMNVVPGAVELGIDIRGIDSQSIGRLVESLKDNIKKIMDNRQLKYEMQIISSSEPVKLSHEVIDGLKKAASNLNVDYIEMPSGAGHDAMEMASVTKAGMVFIPCVEGISHNKAEKAELQDIYKGSKIMFEYLKEDCI